jgi:TrmH family RNA methyltransferase
MIRAYNVRMSLPIRIVLVETSHAGNIGAAARAMKNMGLTDLRLVKPHEFPHLDAYARASGAEDVLNAAQVHGSLAEAVSDCGWVVGTSSRQRHIPFAPLEPRECAQRLVAAAAANRVAVVFGSERVGLTNAELALCNALVTIPTSESYASLNVAMAVQVIAYEIFLATRVAATASAIETLATAAELEGFYKHLEQVLEGTDFRDHSGSGQSMMRLRRLFGRSQPDQIEIRILRGILSALGAKRRAVT